MAAHRVVSHIVIPMLALLGATLATAQTLKPPSITLPPLPPSFTGAAIKTPSQFILYSPANIQTVQGLCSDATGNNVCLLLSSDYTVTLNGTTATQSRLVAGNLICTLPAPMAFTDGQAVTVSLTKPSQGGVGTTRSFTAFQCTPNLTAISNSGNTFTLTGTGLEPALPAFTRKLTVFEFAQGTPIATIPSTITSSSKTKLVVTLTHPNLARKILQFHLDTTAPGWGDAVSTVVLRDATTAGGPDTNGRTASREFRMTGALDTNAALDAGGTPDLWAPGATAPASGIPVFVGGDFTYETFPVNRGAAISNLTLELTTTGPLALGYLNASGALPLIRKLTDITTKLALTYATTNDNKYTCTIPSIPEGTDPWQLLMPFHATGTANATGTILLRTSGPTATEQDVTLPVTIQYDPTKLADCTVSPSTFTSTVTAGTDYTRSDFGALTHVLHVSFKNHGPSALDPGCIMVVTVQSPPAASVAWRVMAGSPVAPEVHFNASLGPIINVTCTTSAPVGIDQTATFDIPIRLTDVLGSANFPACTASCLPTSLEVSAKLVAASKIDVNPGDNASPVQGTVSRDAQGRTIGLMQSVKLCAGSWAPSAPTATGEFTKLRCGP